MGRKANIAMKCPEYGEMGPNPLLLRTGRQCRASAAVISAASCLAPSQISLSVELAAHSLCNAGNFLCNDVQVRHDALQSSG